MIATHPSKWSLHHPPLKTYTCLIDGVSDMSYFLMYIHPSTCQKYDSLKVVQERETRAVTNTKREAERAFQQHCGVFFSNFKIISRHR